MPTVQHHVKLTNPNFSLPIAKRAEINGGPVGCDVATTPDCLKALYNMTYTPKATDRNTLGIGKSYFGYAMIGFLMCCLASKLL
jgi:tripeptidyl-peptidase I